VSLGLAGDLLRLPEHDLGRDSRLTRLRALASLQGARSSLVIDKMAIMTSWRDYQEEAAAFFRTLELEATTDESISGARGAHAVDVAVRSRRAGITQLWIVECKLWRRSVGKLHVAALGNIVQDVGADRGILLSESGFQAGAVRLAAHSNITLASLTDLRDNAEHELMMIALDWLRIRITELERARAVENVMHQDKPRFNGLFSRGAPVQFFWPSKVSSRPSLTSGRCSAPSSLRARLGLKRPSHPTLASCSPP
jgi:hypothetical protein